MASWYDDKVFQANDLNSLEELGGIATPAFRLSGQGSLNDSHPLDHIQAYDRLFQVFRPILERHAERLIMNDRAGAKARRRKSITAADWQPLQYLKSVVPSDDRWWIGFDFKSGKTAKVFKGPTGFRLRVARTVQLDATIAVPDFERHDLDLDALRTAILGLPMRSVIAGFGLATSGYFDNHEQALPLLMPVALKYPALDVCPSPLRSWFSDYDQDLNHTWISGINWLTFLAEPFLSALCGADALLRDLPDGVEARVSDNGILFQLGAGPITGQHGVDDAMLPLYHALGRKLEPLGDGCPSARHPREPVFGNDDGDLSLKWERRFYDGCWFEEHGK